MTARERPRRGIVAGAGSDQGCENAHCLGNYDFDNIAHVAKQRFVDGKPTIELLRRASSRREREEIALVAMLDVHDDTVHDLRLDCRHAGTCKTTDCRARLMTMIQEELTR